MADLFGFSESKYQTPLTADKATIEWSGTVTGAVNISIAYNQPINRRRTIGNKDTALWASLPTGQINIQRLLTTNVSALFSSDGWNACKPGTLTLRLAGGCDSKEGITFTATNCIVSQYNVSAEAESLTVVDNLVIEFLQLKQTA